MADELAWASVADVEAILDEEDDAIPTDEADHILVRLKVNLLEATDVVSAYLDRDYGDDDEDDDGVPDDVPPRVRRVVARVALRGFNDFPGQPGVEGTTSTMGPFATHLNWSKEAVAGDFYLTDADKLRLSKYRLGSTKQVGHVSMIGVCGDPVAW